MRTSPAMMKRPTHAFIFGLIVAVLAAGCGEVPEPAAFTVKVSTSSTVPGESVDDEPVPTTVLGQPVTTADFVPRRNDGSLPEILVARNDGLGVVSASRLELYGGEFAAAPVRHAVDDLIGGIVYQENDAAGRILWVSGPESGPTVIDDTGAMLLDVGYADGAPYAVVASGNLIEHIRLVDGVRMEFVALAPTEQLVDLAVSGSLHAIAIANDQCGAIRLYDVDGSLVPLDSPTPVDCDVLGRPTFGALSLSPDGGALAYTDIAYRDDLVEASTDIVVRDLATGADWFRQSVAADFAQIPTISYDGDRVAYLYESPDQVEVRVLPLSGQTEEVVVDLGGQAQVNDLSFARLRVFTSG